MILITGARGFIGRLLHLKLLKMGISAIPLYHTDRLEIDENQWACDLTCSQQLKALGKAVSPPDTVIHLAGYVEIALHANSVATDAPPLPGIGNIPKLYDANVHSTANVLSYCLETGVKHLIFASSQAVYGMPQSCPLTEESPCKPLEHYAMSKLCCEQLLHIGAQQGLNVTTLRFPGVFGEMRRRGVVFEFCRQAVETGMITAEADYPLPLDVLHVDDVIDAFIQAAAWGGRAGGTCMNIATGEPCSLNLLATAVASLVPACQVKTTQIPQPIIAMNASRAESLLGWKAQSQCGRLKTILDTIKHD